MKTIREFAMTHRLVRITINNHWEHFSTDLEHGLYALHRKIWRFIRGHGQEMRELVTNKTHR